MGKENTGFIIKISDKKWKAIVEYPPENGKRVKKTKTVDSEPKAKRALVDLNLAKEHYLKEQKENKNRLPFKDAVSAYKEKLAKRLETGQLKPKTEHDYVIYADALNEEFGLYDLKKITSEDIEKYLDKLLYVNKFAPSTVSKYKIVLGSIFKTSKVPMPTTEAIPNAHKRNLTRIQPLSIEEQTTLKTYIEDVLKKDNGKKNTKWLISYIYFFGLYTGCRCGEIAGLRWRSIKEDEGIIIIDNNLVYVPKKGLINSSPKTTDSIRRLVVSKSTFNLLKELKEIYTKYDYPDSEYVFITRNGTQLTPRNVLRDFQNMCKEAGLTNHHTFHDLRHTNITTKIAKGIDVKTVSLMAGHADTSITLNTYTHYWKEAAQKAANIFEED